MINLPQSYPLSGQAAAVRQLAAARPVCLAWENEHALTFEVGDGPDRCLVKWAPAGCPLDLAAEAERRQVRCAASAPGSRPGVPGWLPLYWQAITRHRRAGQRRS